MNIGEKILGRAENLRARTRRANKKVESSLKNYRVILILYEGLRSIAMSWRYYGFSEFIELLEMMAWICANCYWVSQNRAVAKDIFGNTESGRKELAKESEWGFGQIIPVLLLMLPIMTFIEWLEDNIKENNMPDTSKEEKCLDYREVFDMQDWHEVNT